MMFRATLACLLLLALAPSAHAERLDPNRVQLVVAGVVDWVDPIIDDFDATDRKDAEFYDAMSKWGVPKDQRTKLLDRKASVRGILAALKRAIKRSGPDDTLIFYFSGHGFKYKGTRAMLATGDIIYRRRNGLYADRLTALFKGKFKGRRVLLTGDFCYSGAFADVAASLRASGIDAISLTSAAASNSSTVNWVYSQTLIDAFLGDPGCDRDGDGAITLGELGAEVTDRMRFRERQRAGWDPGHGDDLVLNTTRAGAKAPPTGSWVEVRYKGQGWPAKILETLEDTVRVSLYDYNRYVEFTRPKGQTRPLRFHRYPVGTKLKVLLKGKVHLASVEKVDGDFHYVDYDDLGSGFNEWVASHRVVETADGKSAPGVRRVEVRWTGKWYIAEVLETREDGTLCIHYVGYDQGWDECVLPGRVREIAAPTPR